MMIRRRRSKEEEEDQRSKRRGKAKVLNTICEVFPERNLQINADKIEHTILKRGKKKAEPWREVKRLGSLLGAKKDIAGRKQLFIAAMNNMEKVWIKNNDISKKRRLTLYRTLVKPVLLCNSATWGLKKQVATNLDSFHRQQLWRIIGESYPNKISNRTLYERCQLFGHILRLDEATPVSKAMKFCCKTSELKSFRGKPRETLLSTLLKNIKRVLEADPTFPLQPTKTTIDLQYACQLAKDRIYWNRTIVGAIYRAAEAEELL